jgi:hypothetical protein
MAIGVAQPVSMRLTQGNNNRLSPRIAPTPVVPAQAGIQSNEV